jgi:membrane protease YdiL (CAAX protease family)
MQLFKILCVFFFACTSLVLIALQIKVIGWILFGLGVLTLIFCEKQFSKDFLLIYFCVGVLGLTPISTDVYFPHAIQMGIPLALVILVPYLVSRYIYKDYLLYIIITCFLAYLILPIMLKSTLSYHNWDIDPGWWNLTLSYVGLNAVGFWDELFFISTILGILRRHLPFTAANITQGILFSSFLYTLGFQGWSFIVTFIFALVQGYVFKKTESLFYVLTIHLSFDLILHLALVHLNHPTWIPFLFPFV